MMEIFNYPPKGSLKEIPYWEATISPFEIKAIRQMRKFFDMEKIRDLAVSMAVRGQINEIYVNIKKDGGIIVIAGERRLKAARIAGIRIRCKVFNNLDAKNHYAIQRAENDFENVSIMERAQAMSESWDRFREAYPKGTKIDFCRGEGITTYKLNAALKLTDIIGYKTAELIWKGCLSFTTAVKWLSKIQSHDMQYMVAISICLLSPNQKTIQNWVGRIVWEETHGQESLVDMFGGDIWLKEQRKIHIDRHLHLSASAFLGFIQACNMLISNGTLNGDDIPLEAFRRKTEELNLAIIENRKLMDKFLERSKS